MNETEFAKDYQVYLHDQLKRQGINGYSIGAQGVSLAWHENVLYYSRGKVLMGHIPCPDNSTALQLWASLLRIRRESALNCFVKAKEQPRGK